MVVQCAVVSPVEGCSSVVVSPSSESAQVAHAVRDDLEGLLLVDLDAGEIHHRNQFVDILRLIHREAVGRAVLEELRCFIAAGAPPLRLRFAALRSLIIAAGPPGLAHEPAGRHDTRFDTADGTMTWIVNFEPWPARQGMDASDLQGPVSMTQDYEHASLVFCDLVLIRNALAQQMQLAIEPLDVLVLQTQFCQELALKSVGSRMWQDSLEGLLTIYMTEVMTAYRDSLIQGLRSINDTQAGCQLLQELKLFARAGMIPVITHDAKFGGLIKNNKFSGQPLIIESPNSGAKRIVEWAAKWIIDKDKLEQVPAETIYIFEALTGLRDKMLKKAEVKDPVLSYCFSTNIRNPYILSRLNGSFEGTQDVRTQRTRKPSGSVAGRSSRAVSLESGFATPPSLKLCASAEPVLSTETVGNNGVIVSLGPIRVGAASGEVERESRVADTSAVSLRRITGLIVAQIRRLGRGRRPLIGNE